MRRISASIAAIFLFAGFANAELSWTESEWDFGTIREENGKVSHTFVCRNTGTQTETIERVRSSCGCTAVDYSQMPIAAADSATVTVVYNPALRPGKFEKEIVVATTEKNYRLKISGKSIPTQETIENIFPEKSGNLRLTRRIFAIGDVRQGRHRIANIFAYNDSADSLRLRFGSIPDSYRAYAEPSTVPPEEMTVISMELTAADDAETGFQSHRIALHVGNETDSLTVTSRILPKKGEPHNFQDAPLFHTGVIDRVDFSPIRRDTISQATLNFSNAGFSPLRIVNVASLDDAVTVTSYTREVASGGFGSITLQLDPKRMTDKILNSEIVIFTNDPAQTTVRIRMVGVMEK